MSNKFGRWLRSKSGMWTILGIVAVLLVVAIAGAFLGWWQAIADLISGTVVTPPPPAHWDPPPGGYTCLPTCDETDGRFFSSVGSSMDSFTGNTIVVWIGVPGDYPSFTLGIFDGDSSKNDAGNVGQFYGNWDETTDEVVYTLYADPLMDGAGMTMIGQWRGNQDPMPNNAWYDIPPITNVAAAMAPSGHYFYRLEAVRQGSSWGISAFKLRSNAYLMTGRSGLVDASIAVVGMLSSWNDVPIIYPQSGGMAGYPNAMGESTYDGTWVFHLYVPTDTERLEFWDGDFDRGSTPLDASYDTDDPNTPNTPPPWAGGVARAEGQGNVGSPADDYSWFLWRISPPAIYQIIDPAGVPIYTNAEPSGTEEWERFVLTTDPAAAADADMVVQRIAPGNYTIAIEGLDMHNTVWIRANYTICPTDRCPDVYGGGGCPRTIGYWKNNVYKVLIQGRRNGVQETPESIRHALDLIAMASPLYRQGINVNNPQPIATVARLTDQEANMILQRNHRDYPGGREAANSMRARALQQNLATWLNVMSGKVSANAVVELNVHGGVFHGTIQEALLEAQSIILYGGDLERAKDIADQINNALWGESAPDDLACSEYQTVMPPDQQPPPPEQMPVAPTPVPPAPPVVGCTEPTHNRYNVEITNNPFYGIKFEYQSGDLEIRDGMFDTFSFVLTADQVAALTSIQLEAKAAQNQVQVTMEGCAFNQASTCGPLADATNSYAFQFMGATDNGDGTYTLTFTVYNFTSHGLSHVTFGLPAGAVPTSPTGSYESVICP